MSLDTLRWALNVKPQRATQKLALIYLAKHSNADHEAWPSTEQLKHDTLLDLKTVKKSLADLEAQGFIQDIGKRKGSTGRVKVWRLIIKHAVVECVMPRTTA